MNGTLGKMIKVFLSDVRVAAYPALCLGVLVLISIALPPIGIVTLFCLSLVLFWVGVHSLFETIYINTHSSEYISEDQCNNIADAEGSFIRKFSLVCSQGLNKTILEQTKDRLVDGFKEYVRFVRDSLPERHEMFIGMYILIIKVLLAFTVGVAVGVLIYLLPKGALLSFMILAIYLSMLYRRANRGSI